MDVDDELRVVCCFSAGETGCGLTCAHVGDVAHDCVIADFSDDGVEVMRAAALFLGSPYNRRVVNDFMARTATRDVLYGRLDR
jgi:hypothetical protein